MSALPLALSLTSSFTKVGAIAGFAALVGIAMLSLLAFSQAREIKRLREWAGRAPERASELEQRVSAEAAARMQRTGQPVAPGARVVPRKTPLVSAPVSTAVNATVAAGRIGIPPATPAPGDPSTPGTQSIPEGQPPTPVPAPVGQVALGAAQEPAVEGAVAMSANGEAVVDSKQVSAAESASPASPRQPDAGPGQSAAGPAQPIAAPSEDDGEVEDGEGQDAPAPATAAARAAGAARPSLPPSPTAPAPPSGSAPPVPVPVASPPPASAAAVAGAQAARSGSRPPAPVAAAQRTPSRVAQGSASGVAPARAPSPRGASAGSGAAVGGVAGGASTRPPSSPLSTSGPKYFKPERSAGRTTAMIVGGAIVVVLLVVFAVSELKGSGKPSPAATQTSSTGETQTTRARKSAPVAISKPSEVAVVVLNGTSTNDLAHHLAGDLQQSGYTRAEASAGVPPGTHATTVVEYAHGHHAEAEGVAKALDVSRVQAMESSTAALASSATVVVLAGADQATQLGGGGAQSKGEPAVTGEAGTGAGDAAGEGAAGSGQ